MAISREEWLAKGRRTEVLPSGAEVVIAPPHILELVRRGWFPNELRDFAIRAEQEGIEFDPFETDDPDLFADFIAFLDHLAAATVIEPAISVEDFRGLPPEDRDALYSVVLRKEAMDALRTFRGPEPAGAVAGDNGSHVRTESGDGLPGDR